MSKHATYTFDAASWQTREDALAELVAALPLPEHTGLNLDALADALWELPACDITLVHAAALDGTGPLGPWGRSLRHVLLDVALARNDLRVTLSPLGPRHS